MPILSVFLPLFSFFLFIFFSKIINSNKLIFISIFNIFCATIFSFLVLKNIVLTPQSEQILLFNWLNSGALDSKWLINIDFLSFVMVFELLCLYYEILFALLNVKIVFLI